MRIRILNNVFQSDNDPEKGFLSVLPEELLPGVELSPHPVLLFIFVLHPPVASSPPTTAHIQNCNIDLSFFKPLMKSFLRVPIRIQN
jgi:hypothetical protein